MPTPTIVEIDSDGMSTVVEVLIPGVQGAPGIIAPVANNTIVGNISGSTAAPIGLTAEQVRGMLLPTYTGAPTQKFLSNTNGVLDWSTVDLSQYARTNQANTFNGNQTFNGITDNGGGGGLSYFNQLLATGGIGWSGRAWMFSPSAGVIQLSDNTGATFNRLQFGGTTSAYPALKRSGTTLQARLADDSGYAPFEAGSYGFGSDVSLPVLSNSGSTLRITGYGYTGIIMEPSSGSIVLNGVFDGAIAAKFHAAQTYQVPLAAIGRSGQTANLIEAKNASNTVVASISNAGAGTFSGNLVTSNGVSATGNNSWINFSGDNGNYLGGTTNFRNTGGGAVQASINGATGALTAGSGTFSGNLKTPRIELGGSDNFVISGPSYNVLSATLGGYIVSSNASWNFSTRLNAEAGISSYGVPLFLYERTSQPVVIGAGTTSESTAVIDIALPAKFRGNLTASGIFQSGAVVGSPGTYEKIRINRGGASTNDIVFRILEPGGVNRFTIDGEGHVNSLYGDGNFGGIVRASRIILTGPIYAASGGTSSEINGVLMNYGSITASGTITSTHSSSTIDLSTLDLSTGQSRLHKNTLSGNVKLSVNDGGVIKSVTLA